MWPSAETRSQESHSPLKLPRAPLLSASPSPPAPPLSSCDLFSLPIALPFLECHRNGIIQKLAFRVWFFNLAECWLNECLTLTYVSAKMNLFLVTAEWCIVSCMSQRLLIPAEGHLCDFWYLIARRNINNLRYADDTTLMTESEEELKSLSMKVKEEWKSWLKLNIQKTKIMASGPITSWQIDGETVETVTDFILRGSKIPADGDCSREIKRRLLLGSKAMTNLKSILKSRDII